MSASIIPASSVPPSSAPSSRLPQAYSIHVNESRNEVSFGGMLRPFVGEQMTNIRTTLEAAAKKAEGSLSINLKRLKYMNNVAFLEINRFVQWVSEAHPDLNIKFIVSSVIPWAYRKFRIITELYPRVSVEVYDKSLYPIQQVIEDVEFTNVLLTQEKIVWERERPLLARHGLRSGLRIADIGCGLGDFAVRIQEDFKPEYAVGVDHSRAFLRRAQERARDIGLENIEYQYGDAAALLLPDNSFDFVTCRLALQVFHEPLQIMGELYRICKPGGRVYITNEMMASVTGYPGQDLIRFGYQRFLELSRMVGMDFDIGMRSMEILQDAGLEDIKGDLINISNLNTDREALSKVVESWIVSSGNVAASANAPPSMHEEIAAGLREHIQAIMSDKGYATWPIFAGSGRKPFRTAP